MPRIPIGGVEINYYLDDFTDPWAEDTETLLIHHGANENAKFFIPMVPALARRYRVLRYDSRGRGESSAPPEGSTRSGGPDDFTSLSERYVEDAIGVMDYLGLQKVHWFGQGSGGIIGALLAVFHPDRIKSLVMCTSNYKYPDELKKRNRLGEKDIYTAIYKYGFREYRTRTWGNMVDESKADPKMMEWNLAQRLKTPTHVIAAHFRWVENFDLSGQFAQMKVPTLIMAAEKSAYAPLEQQHFMQQRIPNARLIVFEGVGTGIHMFMPDRCVEAILEFLKTID